MDANRLVGRGSPFELVDGEFRHCPRSLSAWYARTRAAPSQCLIAGEGALTYAEVFRRATLMASRLAAQFGIGPGARVGICAANGPGWLVSFVAITRLGAAAVLIHADTRSAEIARVMGLVRFRLLISDRSDLDGLKRAGLAIIDADEAIGEATGGISTGDHCEADPDSVAVIAPTSGSTRASKWVMVSHRALLNGVMNTLLASALSSHRSRQVRAPSAGAPVSLLFSPLSHVSGYTHFLTMLHVGGTVVTTSCRDARGVAGIIATHSIGSLVGAPTSLIRELVRDRESVALLGSLRSLGIQGVHLPQGLLAEIDAVLPQVAVGSGYGLTETSGLVSLAIGAELAERPQACGRVVPSVGIRIADDGEIWLRGAMLAQGYAGDADANAGAFRDGWLRTGDLGSVDADGYLHVIGRADRSRGVCATLERLALDAEAIDEAVALELEAGSGIRAIVAVVRRRDGGLDIEDLRRRVQDEAGGAARVMEVAALPRTSTGKVDRAALRAAIASQPD